MEPEIFLEFGVLVMWWDVTPKDTPLECMLSITTTGWQQNLDCVHDTRKKPFWALSRPTL